VKSTQKLNILTPKISLWKNLTRITTSIFFLCFTYVSRFIYA